MPGEGGGGYSGFQVSGMIAGFLGVSNFRFRDSFGYENLAIEYFFGWLDLEALGMFFGFDFGPHSIIPDPLNPEYPPPPHLGMHENYSFKEEPKR